MMYKILHFFIVKIFGEIGDTLARRRQNFCNTARGRPPWLTIFRPAFAFVKYRRVQTAASRQTRTRHFVFTGKSVYCIPNITVCHFIHPCLLFCL